MRTKNHEILTISTLVTDGQSPLIPNRKDLGEEKTQCSTKTILFFVILWTLYILTCILFIVFTTYCIQLYMDTDGFIL